VRPRRCPLYSAYKPLRNYLRGFDLWTGLGAVYFYMRFLMFKQPLPDALLTQDLRDGKSALRSHLHGWLVDLMARELILNAQFRGGNPFASAQVAFRTMSDIHRLDGHSWSLHPTRSNDIILQLSRIAFKQFPWQTPFTNSLIARYFKLYAYPPVARMLETELGLTVGEYFQLVLLLVEELVRRPTLAFEFLAPADPTIVAPVQALADRILRSAADLRRSCADKQSFDVNWSYTFNPLREYPLVHGGNPNSILCPAPQLLVQRLTDGLYFDLIRADKGFGDAIGHAFEAYVGEMAKAIGGTAFDLLPEVRYGKPQKGSVDWIVGDGSAWLFAECKLARLDIASQTLISPQPPLAFAIDRLADAIAQLYLTLGEGLAGRYPHWTHDGAPIFPGVVTFYDWFAFGPYFYKTLDAALGPAFAKRGADVELVDHYPFFLCSIGEFEGLLAACRANDLNSVLTAKIGPIHRQWTMQGFLADHYPGSLTEASHVFEDGLDPAIAGPSRFIPERSPSS